MKSKNIVYWVITVLFCFAMLMGGIIDMLGGQMVEEGMNHLGYPMYFARILGFWKVAGVVALLIPKTPWLKEWAYAGFFFNLTGASYSHLMVNDPIPQPIIPLVILSFAIISWYLRPASRRLTKAAPLAEVQAS